MAEPTTTETFFCNRDVRSMNTVETYHEVKDGKLHYRWREGYPVIIYLHGHGSDINGLERQREYFENRGFGSLSYDQRGCGDSLKPLTEEEYSLQSYIDDLNQLIKICEIEKATLIAQSSGTAVAQYFSYLHPEKVNGLILIASVFNPGKNLKKSLYGRALLRAKPIIEITTRLLEGILPSPNTGSSVYPQPGSVSGTGIKSGSRFYFSGTKRFKKALRLRLNRIIKWDLEEEVRSINRPTLLIHGENDNLIDTEIARKLQEMIPRSELEILKGDHEVSKNNYSETNEVISDFLKRRIYPERH